MFLMDALSLMRIESVPLVYPVQSSDHLDFSKYFWAEYFLNNLRDIVVFFGFIFKMSIKLFTFFALRLQMPWLRGTPREPLTPWLLQPKLLMKWLHSLKLGPQLQVNPTELLQTRKRNQNRFKAPCVSWFEISREQLMCWGRILILSNVIYDPWIFKFERLVALRKTSCSKHFSVFTRESAVVNNRFGNAAKFRFTSLL